ncbi:MAG: hypothetical protein WCH11_06175, partial [Bdellovibrio sp.]
MILEGLSSAHLVKRKEIWKAESWPEIQVLESAAEEWRIEGSTADAFVVNPAVSWRLRSQLKFLPSECVRLEQFDLITKDLGSWTAHLVLREVFMHWIPRKRPDLSTVSWAYLCGD